MDRFVWFDASIEAKPVLHSQSCVRLYDGNQKKTAFDKGQAVITTHDVVWTDHSRPTYVIALPLRYIIQIDKDSGSLTKSPKIVLHLSPKDSSSSSSSSSSNDVIKSGPVGSSLYSFVRLSFTDGGHENFYERLNEAVMKKKWLQQPQLQPPQESSIVNKASRMGIGGIERSLEMRRQERDTTISTAFEDLSNLMVKAQEMVTISKNLSNKLKDKQDNVTDDETLQFKQYLMSLGIQDPITKETHGSGDSYYKSLAKQTCEFLEPILKDCGGVMTLTEAYCRVNRARGMELLSPEDLDQACMLFDWLNLSIKMKEFEDGVKVVQLRSCDEAVLALQTEQIVTENGCLTAEQLADIIGLSVVLAKERAQTAEKLGKLCRDESIEGVKFYPNLFASRTN
ncbi:hypothetical protein HELRODRAFT_177933 [Helobdella robusta]|uniref:Vacuolar protein-sorting-associated protein 36 n=1 Tax=Helobdella robusta TaxID=6412 RepID=T1FCH4_HELRO|nr:hypothetical protein HELRODRAFT_177933 [Helobdella robusta]ESN97504.1 hypothetical protein HELRODRAFT_177933 [Helobdella robusta]